MKECVYNIELPGSGVCCNAYSQSERPDKKWWAHWPDCSEDNCPLKRPELLEGAILKKETEE